MSANSSFIYLRAPPRSFRDTLGSLCRTWTLLSKGWLPWSRDWRVQSFVGPLKTTTLRSPVPGEIVFAATLLVPDSTIWLWEFLTWSFWSHRVGLLALFDFMIKYWARQRQPSRANREL